MSKLFTYVDSNGFQTESEAYEVSDFTNVGGIASANKPVILDANGKIDSGMIDASTISHDQLQGLGDDDHVQYLLIDGTRAMTGNLQLGSNEAFSSASPSSASSLVNKAYVDAIGVGNRMKGNVKVATVTPITLSGLQTIDGYAVQAGDRVLVKDQVDAKENGVYVASATAWTRAEDLDNAPQAEILNGVIIPRVQNSASGQETKSFYISSIGTGVDGKHEVGTDDILFDIYTTSTQLVEGNGIVFNGNIVEVDLKDTDSGLHFDGNQDLGIDWATQATDNKAWKASDLDATKIPIIDAGGYTSQTFVEGAVQELYGLIAQNGVSYTVGTGGVTKGDLVYISGTNQVSRYSNTASGQRVVGIALETKLSGETVKVLANDTVIKNVLSGATAGVTYYWNGSSYVTSIPTGSGAYVYIAGYAKNTTDLHVEVDFLKRNAF